MGPSTNSDASLEALATLVQTTKSLLTQLEPVLHAIATDKASPTTPPSPSASESQAPDAIALAHDSAALIRAHTTKLSLLIINAPFTPSAVSKVLRELVAGPIPGIASAVQICDAARYTTVARQDLAWRCYKVLKDLRSLVEIIPLNGSILQGDQKSGARGEKGSLAITGVIWAACDDVILLKKLGAAGLLVKKVEQYRDTLKDVLDELKEWSEEEADDEEEAQDLQYVTDSQQTMHETAQDMLDDLMNPQHIPRDDPDKIRERLESCLKRLRLTTLLYAAIIKRRLKTLPKLPVTGESNVPQRIDEVLPILQRMPNRFGEVACAFYELDVETVDHTMDSCFFDAFAASEMMMKPWDGQKDEFSEWAEKFQSSIKKPD